MIKIEWDRNSAREWSEERLWLYSRAVSWRNGVNRTGTMHFPPFMAQCLILWYFYKLMIFIPQNGVDLLSLAEIGRFSGIQILYNFSNSCFPTWRNGCNCMYWSFSVFLSVCLPISLSLCLLSFFPSFLPFFFLFWFRLPFILPKTTLLLKIMMIIQVQLGLQGIQGSTMLHVIFEG